MKFSFSNIVRQVLNESFQDYEYHFTSIDNLVRICQTGRIPLSHTYAKGAEIGINKNHTFYLSLTRVKDGRVGYSKPYTCRICFDGKALATRFKGGAINYWNGLGDKQQYYSNLLTRREVNPDGTQGRELDNYEHLKPGVKYDIQYKDMSRYKNADPYNYNKGLQTQSSTENEDRLLTNQPFIDNIEKFVTSIDILYVKNENQKYDDATKRKICACVGSKYRNLVRVYDNAKDFNFGTKNVINKKFEWDGEFSMDEGPESTVKDDLENNFDALKKLISIFLYVDCFNKKNNEKALYIKKKLEKYNLGAYSRFISTFINEGIRYLRPNDIGSKFEDAVSTLARSRSQDSQYISKMAGDWMKEHGFKRLGDIAISIKKKYEDVNDKNIDFQKQITFLTYRKVYIIPDPAHTDFWQITEADKYDKEDFVNTMIDYVDGIIDGTERQIRGNDIERFRKYLQHLTHKCTVEQMFSLFKKLDIDPSESFSNRFTDFKYQSLNYFKATDMWLPRYSNIAYNYELSGEQRNKYRKENEKEITKFYLK